MTPNPTPADATASPAVAGQRRHVDCSHASHCLTVAARAGWPAMSCASCDAYTAAEREPPRGASGLARAGET